MPKNISMIIPMFLFIFPGVPCIYYGDEIGLDGHLDSDSGYRYPMQWDEDKQDKDLFNQYQSLINYRQNREVIKSGSFKIIFAENNTIAIVRFNKDKCVMLICSVADKPFDCEIDLKPVGLYNNCMAINQVGDLNWEFNENSINVSFKEKSAIIIELFK
jgi:alpha-glucosidase